MAAQDNKQYSNKPNIQASDADQNQNVTNSTSTVSVACKLPNGLKIDHKGKFLTLKGTNADDAVAGYGITEGVDKEFIASWMEENKDFPAVKNGLIFVNSNRDSSASQAREQEKVKSGLEPLDPKNPAPGIKQLDSNSKSE